MSIQEKQKHSTFKNATKTYKLEVNGYMENDKCGEYAVTNEIRVDGVKVENHYLAK